MGAGTAQDGTEAVVQEFRRLSTGTVFDALERVGCDAFVPGVKPIDGGMRMVGRAFTVGYRSVSTERPGTVGDYLEDVADGHVVVLDNKGRTDCTVWGDILTLVAHHQGVAGTVIDGVCRDTDRAVELGYPLFSLGSTMRTGKGRVEVAHVGEPVSLGQAQVASGDLIIGDRDGVCVIPRARERAVLDAALEIDGAEQAIEGLVAQGHTLASARQEMGYFDLQARDDGSVA